MRYHVLCHGELGESRWAIESHGGPAFCIDDSGWSADRFFRLRGHSAALETEGRISSTWRHHHCDIYRGGELVVQISTSLLADIRARFVGEVPGVDVLTVQGCFVEQNYRFLRCSRTVAAVSTVWDGDGSGFGLDVRDNEDQALILASAIAIRALCGRPRQQVRTLVFAPLQGAVNGAAASPAAVERLAMDRVGARG